MWLVTGGGDQCISPLMTYILTNAWHLHIRDHRCHKNWRSEGCKNRSLLMVQVAFMKQWWDLGKRKALIEQCLVFLCIAGNLITPKNYLLIFFNAGYIKSEISPVPTNKHTFSHLWHIHSICHEIYDPNKRNSAFYILNLVSLNLSLFTSL